MKRFFYLILAVVAATVFWFADSLFHRFVFAEPTFELWPTDANELAMRLIVVILMVLFGIFADYHVHKLMEREKMLRAEIYGSTLSASHHILNNLLNQMQLFRMEAESSKDFDREILREFDQASTDAGQLLAQLSDVSEVCPQRIRSSVHTQKS